jgi:hypothetical protein
VRRLSNAKPTELWKKNLIEQLRTFAEVTLFLFPFFRPDYGLYGSWRTLQFGS